MMTNFINVNSKMFMRVYRLTYSFVLKFYAFLWKLFLKDIIVSLVYEPRRKMEDYSCSEGSNELLNV